jgi:hypothetical protein
MKYAVGFCILAMVGCLALVPATARATGVAVFVIDGRVLEGELLVVRDIALLIDQGGGYKMWEKQHLPSVVLVPFDSIQRVDVRGGLISGMALPSAFVLAWEWVRQPHPPRHRILAAWQ